LEFLQLNENTGYFLRHEYLPQSWNNGILEQWKSGFSKEIIHFYALSSNRILPFAQHSAKASLRAQHSTIPIGAKPLTCIIKIIILIYMRRLISH
jgi:hypothetical protein